MSTLTELRAATAGLLATTDALDDDAFGRASLLPDWTVGHVLAHVALNSDALTRAVRGVLADDPRTMYDSQQSRDHDIAALGAAAPGEIRRRLARGSEEMDEALDALAGADPSLSGVEIERTPGSGRWFPAGAVRTMRLREVQIHHADLDVGFTRHDWPESFVVALIDSFARRAPATLVATDLGRTWEGGDAGLRVSGLGADLAWWLTGRGAGEGLTSDGGLLPGIEAM